MPKLRVALLGAGRIGSFHARTIAYSVPNARLAFIADVAGSLAESLAKELEVERWSDDPLEAIERPDIDAVVIATPGNTHAALIQAAASAGKHIFCEKPIALELPEIDNALEVVERHGVKLQIGFQRRFDSGFLKARDMIRKGEIGKLYMLRSVTRDPQLPDENYMKTCGGLFRDTMVHDFDIIRFLSGLEVEDIYASGSALVDPMVERYQDVDNAVVIMKLQGGIIATIENSRQAVYGYDVRAEVLGSEGAIRIEHSHETPVTHYSRTGVCEDHVYWFIERFASAYRAEILSFIRSVIEDTEPAVTGIDGRKATVLGLAADRSLRTGKPVRVETL